MATMPPVALGVILSSAFLVVLLLRNPLEKYFVLPVVETAQPRRQFAVDLCLCLIAGVLGNAANMILFDIPVYTGGSLMIGCLIAGFFIALDTALARERFVIQAAVARNNELPPPARLYSMTKKFSLVALTVTVFISIIFTLVFSRDIVWLSQIEKNEAALYQAQQGKKVTVIDMITESEIGKDTGFLNRICLMELLRQHGVEIRTEVKLQEITDVGVLVIDKEWNRFEIPADTVVLASGFKALSAIVEELQGLAREVYVVGDCSNPRNLMAAIHDAFNIAVEI